MSKDKGLEKVPTSRLFHEQLISLNNLDSLGFEEWIFLPAMLFGSFHKWWGDLGKRQTPHEGLDLCSYRTKKGDIDYLTRETKIPVILEGEVLKVADDFLGESVFVRHDAYDSNGSQLYTIYGHIKPRIQIRPGMRVTGGDIIGVIADSGNGGMVIPYHLHISVAWILNTVHLDYLGWQMINDPSKVVLIDPLTVIECPYSVVPTL